MDVKNVFIILLLACLLANVTATADLPIKPGYKVVSTFHVSGDQVDCLKLLADMRSCSNGIVGFLRKTQNSFHPDCCHFISTLNNNCSPTTLKSFGFTIEVVNTLQGHCDEASNPAPAPLAGSYTLLGN
ncbi:hypothetical protein FH972_002802 [Carpinus fangiana]|uniref:Prolamin-like domain-containing protein n=1 Tax=Carpinus fangiana TaxID=176857 RepID=A0A5N6QGD5_9ROSI|nr:hypothetical protein FH972_002802 [Carpinus fangiana]